MTVMAWDEWTRHDATALAAEVRAGRVTPRELAEQAAEGVALSRSFRAPGDRDMVRRWAEQAALDMLRRHLEGSTDPAALGPEIGVRSGPPAGN